MKMYTLLEGVRNPEHSLDSAISLLFAPYRHVSVHIPLDTDLRFENIGK